MDNGLSLRTLNSTKLNLQSEFADAFRESEVLRHRCLILFSWVASSSERNSTGFSGVRDAYSDNLEMGKKTFERILTAGMENCCSHSARIGLFSLLEGFDILAVFMLTKVCMETKT